MIIKTKRKQLHALFPGTLPPGKDSGPGIEVNQMLSLGEHDKLLYIMCTSTLYVLCHKGYYTVYISE